MSSANGIDLTKCISKGMSSEISKNITIIAYTASYLQQVFAGMNDFFYKPAAIFDFKMAIGVHCIKHNSKD